MKQEKYQDLYIHKQDGIPRCQMLELITRLARKYFPDEADFPSSLFRFLTQVMPKERTKHESGKYSYTARNVTITSETDETDETERN